MIEYTTFTGNGFMLVMISLMLLVPLFAAFVIVGTVSRLHEKDALGDRLSGVY